MDDKQSACVEAYSRLKNLRLVGRELGMPWQSVYVYLKRAGVAVTGDKTRYGSDKDRLAARAEQEFQRLVPVAENQNNGKFQPKVDFMVGAYKVDVKASLKHPQNSSKYLRWAFSLKKQEMLADFIVCFGYYDSVTYKVFLLPGEIIRKYMTVSIPVAGKSKWLDYRVLPTELGPFFTALQEGLAA